MFKLWDLLHTHAGKTLVRRGIQADTDAEHSLQSQLRTLDCHKITLFVFVFLIEALFSLFYCVHTQTQTSASLSLSLSRPQTETGRKCG